jgi:hypothetical protein
MIAPLKVWTVGCIPGAIPSWKERIARRCTLTTTRSLDLRMLENTHR